MIKNFVIIASITVNLSFLYYFYQNLNADPRTVESTSALQAANLSKTEDATPKQAQRNLAPIVMPTEDFKAQDRAQGFPSEWQDGNYTSLAIMLRAQSYTEDLVRQIVLATITRDQLLANQGNEQSPYWLQAKADLPGDDQILSEEENKRLLLVNIFGTDIINDPLFETLFKPLNASLPFLDSDKQIAIYDLRQRRDSSARERSRGGFITEMREDRFKESEDFEVSLKSILSADEYLNYQLRESKLSDRMKQTMSSFDYSEREFRDIFSIRSSHEGSEFTKLRDRESFRTLRNASQTEIKSYLGIDRYKAFERSQDPTYRSLIAIGERYGNTSREITEVYEISLAAQNNVGEIRSNESLSKDQRRDQITETRNRAMEEITNIAGEETATSIQSNTNRFRRFRGTH
ncbi:MAG: hypothetical protein ACJAVI_002250 [Candidatus Azotimanducaceae bacterium]|jgi:hypothetical protein